MVARDTVGNSVPVGSKLVPRVQSEVGRSSVWEEVDG
jgi:hypothetical protein